MSKPVQAIGHQRPVCKPVVIVGCRRSGTSLLRAMLAQHPDLLVHPQEPQFLVGLKQRHGDRVRDLTRAVRYVCGHPYCASEVRYPALLDRARERRVGLTSEFVQTYLSLWGGDELKRRTPVLKDPAFVFHLGLLAEWFPDMRVIHIYRDPRGNVASQRARWPAATVTECAVWWKEAVVSARKWGTQNTQSYFELSYEDLVCTPEDLLPGLCNFLEVQYAPGMLEFDLEEAQYLAGGPPMTRRYSQVDPSRIDRWKKLLTASDVYLIERIAELDMERLGYRRSNLQGTPFRSQVRRLVEAVHYLTLRSARRVKHAARELAWRRGWLA